MRSLMKWLVLPSLVAGAILVGGTSTANADGGHYHARYGAYGHGRHCGPGYYGPPRPYAYRSYRAYPAYPYARTYYGPAPYYNRGPSYSFGFSYRW